MKTYSSPTRAEESRLVPCARCGSLRFKAKWALAGFSYVECARCGLTQQNPQPLPSQVIDRYADDYFAYETENSESFLRLMLLGLNDLGFERIARALLARDEAPRFLDIGCATGALVARLAAEGWDAQGLEVCEGAARYGIEKRGARIHIGPLESADWPDASFDAIHASHLIEHLNDPAGFLARVARLLKPGGYFFLVTPDISGLQARLFKSAWRSVIFDHLYLFSRKDLRDMARRVGLKPEKTASWGGLAAGSPWPRLKPIADRLAKRLNFGDVVALRLKNKPAF